MSEGRPNWDNLYPPNMADFARKSIIVTFPESMPFFRILLWLRDNLNYNGYSCAPELITTKENLVKETDRWRCYVSAVHVSAVHPIRIWRRSYCEYINTSYFWYIEKTIHHVLFDPEYKGKALIMKLEL